MNQRKILVQHQKRMLAFFITHKKNPQFVDMRLGKTLVLCRGMALLEAFGIRFKRVLVVTSLSAFDGWKEHIQEQFGINPAELIGTKKQRVKALDSNKKWNILNWEGYKAVWQINEIKWDMVILDESHKIKNPQSKVSKFFTRNFRDVEYKTILTGTPDPESRLEFFQQMLFLEDKPFGCKNYWEFRLKYFRPGGFHEWKLKPKAEEKIVNYLKDRALFIDYKSAKIPQRKTYERRVFNLPAKLQKIYKTVEKEFILETPRIFEKTLAAGQKYSWLRRLCCGLVKQKLEWTERVRDIVELCNGEFKNQQIVIWCNFVDEVELLSQFLNKKKIITRWVHGGLKHRKPLEKLFLAGGFKVLVAQVDCYTYGCDFQNADVEIYHSCPLSNVVRTQTEQRLFHIKKKRPILVLDYLNRNCVDYDIYKAWKMKLKTSQKIKYLVQQMELRNG